MIYPTNDIKPGIYNYIIILTDFFRTSRAYKFDVEVIISKNSINKPELNYD
jgi:hypothetical protein